MNRFVHVGFHFFLPFPTTKALEPAFDQIGNWIRYAGNCWIVWTDKSPDQIFQILKPRIGENDQFLIAPLDLTTHQGWMPQWVWDWINSKQYQNPLAGLAGYNLNPLASLGGFGGLPPPPPGKK